ncbi:hypothetical protein HYW75_01395 [Candidatus Pacearchaeota archaeon]|nr:hypothetical protein [Candidatus Pacearchaeota archaeon]
MVIKGEFRHFNRESFFIPLEEIIDKQFGTPLNNFRVFQLDRIESGTPYVKTPSYEPPYFGPEKVVVNNPHLWSPEDMMDNCLRSLGVHGYKGRGALQLGLQKIKARRDKKSLVPEEYLVKT